MRSVALHSACGYCCIFHLLQWKILATCTKRSNCHQGVATGELLSSLLGPNGFRGRDYPGCTRKKQGTLWLVMCLALRPREGPVRSVRADSKAPRKHRVYSPFLTQTRVRPRTGALAPSALSPTSQGPPHARVRM